MQPTSLIGILPLLVSGFFFNLIFWPTRFFCARADGQRLFFQSAGSGLLLGMLAFAMAPLVRAMIVSSSALAMIAPWFSTTYPFPNAAALSLALVLGPALALVLNLLLAGLRHLFAESGLPTISWINQGLTKRYGHPLAQLLRRAVDEQKLIFVALKSRKVYVGRVLEIPGDTESENAYLELLPKFSTARDKDSLRLISHRTEYPAFTVWEARRFKESREEVRNELRSTKLPSGTTEEDRSEALKELENDIAQADAELKKIPVHDEFSIQDWLKVIPISEIELASFYDDRAHAAWFADSNKGGDGELGQIGGRSNLQLEVGRVTDGPEGPVA